MKILHISTRHTPPPPGFSKKALRAFTLIELLVVVLIIGILAAVALPQYSRAVMRAKITDNITLVKAATDSFERYYHENGQYPDIATSYVSDPSSLNDFLDISLPAAKGTTQYVYSKGAYFAIIMPVKGISLHISQSFRHSQMGTTHTDRAGYTECWTEETTVTNSEAQNICKALCGVNTLVRLWGSPQLGCLIGNPGYSGAY